MFEQIALNAPSASRRSLALRSLGINNSLSNGRTGFDEAHRGERQQLRQQRLLQGKSLAESVSGGQPTRNIYSANNKTATPGTLVRSEGAAPTNDVEVNEAYDYMGATYDFYWNIFKRDSIDDMGQPLIGTVHYDKDYDNAFWDGQQMIYGDGDGQQFNRFTIAPDVIGHELTHGVTQNEAGLIYWKQTGALNESISDVFGSLVKQYMYNQTADQADWLIGAGLFLPGVQGIAIRSLAAPGTAYDDPILGKDPQPSHMNNYVNTIQDSGGVHINSGIANYAFYLASVYIGGYAWLTTGYIWYTTLCQHYSRLRKDSGLRKTAQFQDFAELTVQNALQLYGGSTSTEVQAIRAGWAEVGIYV